MIKRIVKLTFIPAEEETFLAIFEKAKPLIRQSKGCQHLELLKAKSTEEEVIFFTYSFWDSEDDLNAYRHTDLFATTWAKTKQLFLKKPEAWTVYPITELS